MNIKDRFSRIRMQTEAICKPLAIEDYVVQPATYVSPPKWHLAHTTWFFEQFVLVKFAPNYRLFHPSFAFLFNSYYNNMGNRTPRSDRGFMTRPTVGEVMAYRKHVTQALVNLLECNDAQELHSLVEIGMQHEQQHQELLAYDIKYILGTQPLYPAYGDWCVQKQERHVQKWIQIEEGVYEVGHDKDSFCFDNEKPLHKVYLQEAKLSNKLVTNGEYLEFIKEGGYQNFNLWHDEGWHFIQNNYIQQPLYWHFRDEEWWNYTFQGLTKVDLSLPVTHISMYEAHAFAEWKGMRLPTEFEWEVASRYFDWGQLWEWTNSAYLPYPGFKKAEGALGEYNGKFMINQMVLRGASLATPLGHQRSTYRNFFHPSSRWTFAGIRLAK